MLYFIFAALYPVGSLGASIPLISVLPLVNTSPLSPEGRIVGGQSTTIEKHPWQVSVQMLGFHVCGGSIISTNFVLTAGHCTSYPTNWMSIRVNSSIKQRGGSVHRVSQIVRHEAYSMNDLGVPDNDIALLRLRTAIEYGPGSQPIGLYNNKEHVQEDILATISGWGALTEGGSSPQVLHSVDVPIIAKSVCNEAYQFQGGILQGQICAAYPQGGKDTCQGDSGGPLVINGRQAGIVSWGNGCARKGYPGVYTEIAYFHHWICTHADV